MKIPEKGDQPDRPDILVIPPAPFLGRIRCIGPAQSSIIVGPGSRGRRHWVHPPPIIGRQRRGTHYGGRPRQCGGVQPLPKGHTHQWEEGNDQD